MFDCEIDAQAVRLFGCEPEQNPQCRRGTPV
jgi:hypothetical protein